MDPPADLVSFVAAQALDDIEEPVQSLTDEEEETLQLSTPLLVGAGVAIFVGGTVVAGGLVKVISANRAETFSRQVKKPGTTSSAVDAYASMVADGATDPSMAISI